MAGLARIHVCLWLSLAHLLLAPGHDIYVSSSGNDQEAGDSPESAVRSLSRAAELASGRASVVHVEAGKYQLLAPLTLGKADSHVRWVAEGPVSVSGGVEVSNWQLVVSIFAGTPSDLRVVSADVRTLGSRSQDRHLYVNGRRAQRARLPEEHGTKIFAGAKLTDEGYDLKKSKLASTGILRPGAEFVFPRSTSPWTEPRCAVVAANESAVVMAQPCWKNLRHKPCGQGVKGMPTGNTGYVENVGPEFLQAPGDWSLDSENGTLYYALREGEAADTMTAVMPVLEVLLNVSGAVAIRFEGFTFEHGTWLRPGLPEGYVEMQSGQCLMGPSELNWDCDKKGTSGADWYWSKKSPGNIVVAGSVGIELIRCEFTRLGAAAAVDFTNSQNCLVADSFIHEVSGAGVQIGSFDEPNAKGDVNNTVRNTIIRGAGLEFSGTAGISVGYTEGSVLWGNEVSDVGFSGISVGWGWSRHECWNCTAARDNVIAFNNVHGYKQRMNDGGGIYMLGPQNGSVVHDNWVHNQTRNAGAGGPLYPDEGSAYSTWSRNVISHIRPHGFWLFLWTGSIHDIIVQDNFASSNHTFDAGTRCPLINNTFFDDSLVPLAAKAIMDAAGVNASNPWAKSEFEVFV
mmetsp:Transcript_69229/g.122454  ORF Transcript_69229/g.122454 Transcript_69229/m.122454 type:complete len:627 (-) Transcript_69229:52-1932(-)